MTNDRVFKEISDEEEGTHFKMEVFQVNKGVRGPSVHYRTLDEHGGSLKARESSIVQQLAIIAPQVLYQLRQVVGLKTEKPDAST